MDIECNYPKDDIYRREIDYIGNLMKINVVVSAACLQGYKQTEYFANSNETIVLFCPTLIYMYVCMYVLEERENTRRKRTTICYQEQSLNVRATLDRFQVCDATAFDTFYLLYLEFQRP